MTKKNHTSPALTPHSEAEALVVQHALAFYTVGLRRLAVYAGAGNSFALASEHLETYCGLHISHMTVRKLS